MLKVSQLIIYPIKSMGGIEVTTARVTDRGFQYDRRWMLVDEHDRFISQREVPEMALLQVTIAENGLLVSNKVHGSSLMISFQPQTDEFAEVIIWDDRCAGQFVSHEADLWFTEILGINCRLVYMPDNAIRATEAEYTPAGHITSLSDGYPFLLVGQTSLDDLNKRLAEPLPMDRLRPNIVFTGGEPFAEDLMKSFTIGNIQFNGVKLCARCPVTTIDQQTGERGKEPLKLLSAYRKRNNKVYFGQNLIHEGIGEISVGDEIKVSQFNDEQRFFI